MPRKPVRLALRHHALALLGLVLAGVCASAQENGVPLRVAVFPHGPAGLSTAQAARLIEDFSQDLGRPAQWAAVTSPERLFGQLAQGEADLVVGTLPQALAGDPRVAPSNPVATQRFVVVGRRDKVAANPLALAGKQIGLSGRTPLWSYFGKLAQVVDGLALRRLAANVDREAALDLVESGALDAVVVDADRAGVFLQAHPALATWFDLTGDEPVRWYVRRGDEFLRSRLNAFLERYHAAYEQPLAAPRDFATIQKSRVLRVITRLERPNYYIDRGRPTGFEFDAARAFAQRHGLRLEVLVAADEREMVEWLTSGAGDLLTARLNTETRARFPQLAASVEYHHTAYAVVSRQDLVLESPLALEGRRLAAPAASAEWRALNSSPPGYVSWVPEALPVEATQETLLRQVAEGRLEAAVVPGDTAARVAASHPGLRVGPSLPHTYAYRWTSRAADPALGEAVDEFLQEASRTGLMGFLASRHFDEGPRAPREGKPGDSLSPFDSLVRQYAERYGFDWRLIAAQMYQESQFDPQALSPSGAVGLLQLMPSTAGALGFANLTRPESSIHAGVKYLYTLRSEFQQEIPVGERTWFALAAYNLGLQGVERARALASRMALDPNRWAGNVEKAMGELARRAGRNDGPRYGQALLYVRAIRSLYGTYRNLPSLAGAGRSGEPSA